MMSSYHAYVIFTCSIRCKVLMWFISGPKLPTSADPTSDMLTTTYHYQHRDVRHKLVAHIH